MMIAAVSTGAGTVGAGWASAHPGKNQGGHGHPGNFSRGLKTSWQQFVNESIAVSNLCAW